ncbi:MAG TPA: type II toxin-antitoxin system VapC family toxin [Thermoanaerobaculia bacterium]
MGSLRERLGPKVYLDANFFIYVLEAVEPWARVAGEVLGALDRGELAAVTSELSLAECLVKPMELGRSEVTEAYLEFLQNRRFLAIGPVSREILIEAAHLRGLSRIKLPDAIHAATALQKGCSSFLTNDDRLKIEGIEVLRWQALETFMFPGES